MKIYVGNMSYDTTEEDIRLACEAFGKVESATIIKDKYSGRPKGFGFVEMPSKAEGQAAIDGLNGKELNGRSLNVNEARPRTENFEGSTGGYGGGKGGYGGDKKGGYGGGKGGYGGDKRGGYGGGKGGYSSDKKGGYGGGKGGYGGGKGGRGR
jgi:RNA recognition motif-containing protein